MNLEMCEKLVEIETKKQTAERILELYETIASMAKVIDTTIGITLKEKTLIDLYNNEDYRNQVFYKLEELYGEMGMDFYKFAIGYEIGKKSK